MRLLRWLYCHMVDHDWRVLACDERKAACLGHLHTLAGCFAICRRCHEVRDDFRPLHETPVPGLDPPTRDAAPLPLPKATVRS